jgi:hypothetical protein
MTDEMALEDATLQEHLILLQDKIEAKVRSAGARGAGSGPVSAQPQGGRPGPGPGPGDCDEAA